MVESVEEEGGGEEVERGGEPMKGGHEAEKGAGEEAQGRELGEREGAKGVENAAVGGAQGGYGRGLEQVEFEEEGEKRGEVGGERLG